MIEPELKEHLSILENKLDTLSRKDRHWTQFIGGVFYGLGYVTGAVVLIVIIGWIMNIIGVIPAFNHYVGDFKNALDTLSNSSLH